MRFLLVLLIIGAAGYFGYENVNLKKELTGVRQELAKTKAELARAEDKKREDPTGAGVRVVENAEFTTKTLVCTHCKGEGQYAVGSSSGRTRYASCPMCAGSGSVTLRMPNTPGVRMCPTCRGMGKLVVQGIGLSQGGRVSTTMDRRCGGKGYLQPSATN